MEVKTIANKRVFTEICFTKREIIDALCEKFNLEQDGEEWEEIELYFPSDGGCAYLSYFYEEEIKD